MHGSDARSGHGVGARLGCATFPLVRHPAPVLALQERVDPAAYTAPRAAEGRRGSDAMRMAPETPEPAHGAAYRPGVRRAQARAPGPAQSGAGTARAGMREDGPPPATPLLRGAPARGQRPP